MKDRTVWIILVLLALVAGGIYLLRGRSDRATIERAQAAVPATPPAAAPVTVPRPDPAVPTVRMGRNGPQVPVQDGKTIDMSSGRAIVRDDDRSRAAIEKAKKDMADAAAEVTFRPQPAPKQADPAPKP